MQNNELELRQWIGQQLEAQAFQFHPLPGDASFRTYYRIHLDNTSYIAMLAPPTKERTDEFVRIAKAWHHCGLQVPEVLAWEREKGFVLLTDFGDELLLQHLNSQTVDNFYANAMHALIHLQETCPKEVSLPPYDARYALLELSYFKEWFINKLLNMPFSEQESAMWQNVENQLINIFCTQPQVPVHRDYHSRNLMVLPNANLGIIDFQDAMVGPITYDLVSLLKDCYITWPHGEVNRWAVNFYEKLKTQTKLCRHVTQNDFIQWFDWVGLQRHLKVLGVFSRLNLRDNKPHYLKHLPRIMQYVLEVTEKYPVFIGFNEYLQNRVLPKMQNELTNYNINAHTEVKVA